jgi:hypothetical protein
VTDSSMLDTIRQAEAARRASGMSRHQKLAVLKSAGWQNSDGNRWRSRDGSAYLPFASAVITQLLRDLDGSR